MARQRPHGALTMPNDDRRLDEAIAQLLLGDRTRTWTAEQLAAELGQSRLSVILAATRLLDERRVRRVGPGRYRAGN